MIKIRNRHILKIIEVNKIIDVNNLNGWARSQKLPVNNFELIEDTSQFNEYFIKNYNEEGDKGYFLEVDLQYTEKVYELHNHLPFLPERMNTEKSQSLLLIYMIILNMLFK